MIRRYGRSAARARALQERHQIAETTPEAAGRPLGRCQLCGGSHGFPDHRRVCETCGREACFAGCEHGGEGRRS